MRSPLVFAFCLAVVFSTTCVFADKALPNEALPVEPAGAAAAPVKLVVKRDAKAETSRIVIPAKFLPGRAADGVNAKIGGISPARSIVAGTALSAAIVGVFIALRRGKRAPAIAALLLGVVALGAAAPAVADLLPPREDPAAQIVIEVVGDGDEVVLIRGGDFPR